MNIPDVIYKEIPSPIKDCTFPVALTDDTMNERKEKVLDRMRKRRLDKLLVYCDVEHSGNFSYLIGFYTRFEEAVLVLDKNGEMVLMLGNENLNKCSKARFQCRPIHVSLFSLPNQPNRNDKSFAELLSEAGLESGQRIGIVGWKLFSGTADVTDEMFDIPCFILDAVRRLVGDTRLITNETALFIGSDGARITNNANEIAHYEFGASLASDCILDAMDAIETGVSELTLGDKLTRFGQHTSVTTIASTGERFVKGNLFPTDRVVRIGDPISLTVGYSGGLSSRAGYAVHSRDELSDSAKAYLEELAIPYFRAYAKWLEAIRIGMTGGELYRMIETVLPKSEYNWSLCPGHLTAEEEWLSSPIYENSCDILQSGMIFQIDIIPSRPGMSGVSAESTIVLADTELKNQIRREYPDLWNRMQNRTRYIKDSLAIDLSDDVLPMCSTVGYLRPYLLDRKKALAFSFSTQYGT